MDLKEKKDIVIRLLADALPAGDISYVRSVVSHDCVTNRAGFAALYAATGDPIPQKRKFPPVDGNRLGPSIRSIR